MGLSQRSDGHCGLLKTAGFRGEAVLPRVPPHLHDTVRRPWAPRSCCFAERAEASLKRQCVRSPGDFLKSGILDLSARVLSDLASTLRRLLGEGTELLEVHSCN